MSYSILPLARENDLNKILKTQRFSRENIHILFLSLWDKFSDSLREELLSKYSEEEEPGQKVYLVDSFNMPHSFVIFKTTKIPHLIQMRQNKLVSEDYLPRILKILKLS